MKKWLMKDSSLDSVKEVIAKNTGVSVEVLQNPPQNPFLVNLKEAAIITREALNKQLPVTIVGDYDCDGITSSSILKLGFEELGVLPTVIIPKRFSEGYGINMSIIDRIDTGLLITVDNGIAAVEQITKAKEKGLIVVIIDHHIIRDDGILPPADVIVDPHAIPGSEFNGYCGAGLAYRFILELNPETKIKDKLVALAGVGTVADVMVLRDDNRRLVMDSLDVLNEGLGPLGLMTLIEELRLERVTEGDYGFKLGPCINASGRLLDDGATKVYELLSKDAKSNSLKAILVKEDLKEKAQELISLNEQRKEMVRVQMQKVNELLDLENIPKPIVLYSPDFTEGIIGILAGQLSEKYKVPALVFTDTEKSPDIIKGSGRSPEGIDLKKLLDNVSDCFVGYGGHAGAAGMSLLRTNLDKLKHKLGEELKHHSLEYDDEIVYYDLSINSNAVPMITAEVVKYGPYGDGCPELIFKISDVKCVPKKNAHYVLMGKHSQHIRLHGSNEVSYSGFDLAEAFSEAGYPMQFDCIGKLSMNYFNGNATPQVEIIDFCSKGKEKTSTFQSLSSTLSFI